MFEPRTTRNTRTIYSRKRLRLIKPSHGASVSFRDSYQIFVFPAKNWPQENTRNTKKRICISAHFAFLCGSHLWLRRQPPRVHSRSFASIRGSKSNGHCCQRRFHIRFPSQVIEA